MKISSIYDYFSSLFFKEKKKEPSNIKTLNVRDFTETPGLSRKEWTPGRSGEEFRDLYLIPFIMEHKFICVNFDGAFAYSHSFLDEAFGGLMREIKSGKLDISEESIRFLIAHLVSDYNPSLIIGAQRYLSAHSGVQ